MSFVATYDSLFGRMVAVSTDGVSLSSLKFVPESESRESDLPIFQLTFRLLDDYFAGIHSEEMPPIDVKATPFQKKVWHELRKVHAATIITYSELGRRVGCQSARAIGNAVAANPILILIPCHRVVRVGDLGNYSAGRELKAALLNHELRCSVEQGEEGCKL